MRRIFLAGQTKELFQLLALSMVNNTIYVEEQKLDEVN